MTIKERVDEIKKKFPQYEIEIYNLDMLENNRLNNLWFGGCLGHIKTPNYMIYLKSIGDVICTLFINGEEIAYVKDKGNNGRFYEEMCLHIKDDNELSKILSNNFINDEEIKSKNKVLFISYNNWIEYEINELNDESGEISHTMHSLPLYDNIADSYNILEAFEEVDDMIKKYEEVRNEALCKNSKERSM